MRVLFVNTSFAIREYLMRFLRAMAWRVLWFVRHPHSNGGRPRSILVVELTRMGDVLFAAGLARDLRHSFPGTRIGLAVSPAYASLVKELAPGIVPVPLRAGVRQYCRALLPGRGGAWDLGVTASPALRNLAGVLTAGCRSVDGYLRPPRRWWAYRPEAVAGLLKSGPRTVPSEHLSRRAGRILAATCARFRRRPRHRNPATGTGTRIRSVVMHAGGVWRFRRWPAERWVTLARVLRSRGLKVTLILGPENAGEAGAYGALWGSGAVIRSAPPLSELVRLLRSADLFIGPDSGVMHLAEMMGRKVVALMGPSLPVQSGPLGRKSLVVRGKVPCSPCSQCLCVRPFAPCMDRIGVGEVVDSVCHPKSRGA
jgi:hypothetical protein